MLFTAVFPLTSLILSTGVQKVLHESTYPIMHAVFGGTPLATGILVYIGKGPI
jgi:hypothetical protein